MPLSNYILREYTSATLPKSFPNYSLSMSKTRFFSCQEKNERYFFHKDISRIDKKIKRLIQITNNNNKSNIKPIQFCSTLLYSTPTRQPHIPKITSTLNSINTTHNSFVTNISPQIFGQEAQLDQLQDNWLVDLSNTQIPIQVKLLLQLGGNFGLPPTSINRNKVAINFIKHIEKNLTKTPNQICESVRNSSIPIINRILHNNFAPISNNKYISSLLNSTKSFIKEHPEIFFTKADKGNTTVIMNKNEYINKMTEMLADSSTYTIIHHDPIRKLTQDLRNLLYRWKNKQFIDMLTYRKLYTTDGILPRAYGLTKIHKQGFPLRIIVSSIGSPLYHLANFLHNIIKSSIPMPHSQIINSYHLVSKLSGNYFDSKFELASLDVVSLFTNVPTDLVFISLQKRWNLISLNTDIPMSEFLTATRLVLDSTFFSFNHIIYKQIFGTPMGSPLSPIISDIVLQDIETEALKLCQHEIPIFYRYVDDILFAASRQHFSDILNIFNSFHPRLQFTLEHNTNNTINFLDTKIIINNNTITFDLYKKPTFSGRYLSFHSQHPISQKKGIIFGMVDKTMLLSHPRYHQQNLIDWINVLLRNGYPLPFIFNTINSRLSLHVKKEFLQIYKSNNNNADQMSDAEYFTIPYIKSVSESFIPISKKYGFNIAFSIPSTLHSFIKCGKDRLDRMSQHGVVYKITCHDCDASYIGQTKRQLRTRIKEHVSDINKKSGSPSVISEHRLRFNHDFEWDNVKIIDNELSYQKRIISEMVYIKKQQNGLNKQSDTDLLPSILHM